MPDGTSKWQALTDDELRLLSWALGTSDMIEEADDGDKMLRLENEIEAERTSRAEMQQ